MTWWNRWVDHVHRPIDSRPLRLTMVLIALCVVGDLTDMAWRGALSACLDPQVGLAAKSARWYLLDDLQWGGPLVYGLSLVSALMVVARVQTRPALLVLLVSYSQLGHLFVPGDRGIDRILRTALLVLVFSAVPTAKAQVAAWPAHLLRWLLVCGFTELGWACR